MGYIGQGSSVYFLYKKREVSLRPRGFLELCMGNISLRTMASAVAGHGGAIAILTAQAILMQEGTQQRVAALVGRRTSLARLGLP